MSFILNPKSSVCVGTAAISSGYQLREIGCVATLCLDCFHVHFGKPTDRRVFVDLHLTRSDLEAIIIKAQAALEELEDKKS